MSKTEAIRKELEALAAKKSELEAQLKEAEAEEKDNALTARAKAMYDADCMLVEKYMPELKSHDPRIDEFLNSRNIGALSVWLRNDVAHCLKASKLEQSSMDDIKSIVSGCEDFDADDFNECIRDASIRLDFAEAFRHVKDGSALSGDLGYGFSKSDLRVLMNLHKAGKFRKKIEDILTDCNFHYESGLLSDRKYEEFERSLAA